MGFGLFDVIAAPLGGIISSAIGSHSAKSVSADNIAAAREAMQNKHQWEVEDLKQAGLNPILSAHGSTGTTSGSGVAYSPDNPFANFAQNKIALERAKADINTAKATKDNIEADTNRKNLEYMKDYYNLKNFVITSNANTARAVHEAHNAEKQGKLITANTGGVEANTARAKAEQPMWDTVAKISNSAAAIADDVGDWISEKWNKYYMGKR